MAERTADTPTSQRITFRIGNDIGDVIVDDQDIYQGSCIRNHGLCKMRDFKTVHSHWCSKVRPFSNRSMYVMRQLVYYSDLMREPCLWHGSPTRLIRGSASKRPCAFGCGPAMRSRSWPPAILMRRRSPGSWLTMRRALG